jgi:acetyl esterase/lipase
MASEQLQRVREVMRDRLVDRLRNDDVDFVARRAEMEQWTSTAPPLDELEVEPVDAGGVPAEWVTMPGSDPTRVIQYLHGGAYTAGSLNTHRRFVGLLAAATGTRALNVDYRLAPEHPHPAAVDDAVAAYRWLTTAAGVEPGHVVVAGDSAGGGLTAAMLVALRDAGDVLPAGGAMISPWADLTLESSSHDTRIDLDPMCNRHTLAPSAQVYAGTTSRRAPLVSPAHADLSGLPPLVIHVGDHETLLDDSVGLAEAAAKAGVDVDLWVAPEMIHVWHALVGLVPESDEALARLADWIGTRLR